MSGPEVTSPALPGGPGPADGSPDAPIGTLHLDGREIPILEMKSLVIDGVECMDIRTSEGCRRFVGVKAVSMEASGAGEGTQLPRVPGSTPLPPAEYRK